MLRDFLCFISVVFFKYTFHLVAGNGETIGTSEVYTTEANCKNGITSVQNNAGIAEIEDQTLKETKKNPKFEIYEDSASKFRTIQKCEPVFYGGV